MKPRPLPGGRGYGATFRHPLLDGKVTSRGLGTRDPNEAQSIVNDLEKICKDKALHSLENPELLTFKRRAVEIFFEGEEGLEEVLVRCDRLFTDEELQQMEQDFDEAFDERKWGPFFGEELLKGETAEKNRKFVENLEKETARERFMEKAGVFSPRNFRLLQERCKRLEERLTVVMPELYALRDEVKKYRDREAVARNVTIRMAADEWHSEYIKTDIADHRKQQAQSSIDDFVAALPDKDKSLVKDISTSQVDSYLRALKAKVFDKEARRWVFGNEAADARTKQKKKGFLNSFFSWAKKRYELNENPMSDADDIRSGRKKTIHAIDHYEVLVSYLKAFEPWPYWHAWVAFATLGGPSWKDIRNLLLKDVHLDKEYFDLSRAKTGEGGQVPIERTILGPILKAHVATRTSERRVRGGTVGQKSAFLFPSLVEGLQAPKKSLPGQWSSNSVWQGTRRSASPDPERPPATWREILSKAAENAKKLRLRIPPDVWTYTGEEWRHTFGTGLALCGWNALQISRVMLNDAKTCSDYYVKRVSFGPTNRWPLEHPEGTAAG